MHAPLSHTISQSLAQSLAKMRLSEEVVSSDVEEAIRLMKVATQTGEEGDDDALNADHMPLTHLSTHPLTRTRTYSFSRSFMHTLSSHTC